MKSLLSFLKIGISVAAVLVVGLFLIRSIKWQDLLALLQQINGETLMNSVLLISGGIVVKSLRLFHLLYLFPMAQSLSKCLAIQTVSISLGLLTPGRAGELSKIYWLSAHKKNWMGGVTLLCLCERLLDLAVLLGLGLLLSVLVISDQRITLALLVLLGLLVLSSVFLVKADQLLRWIPALQHYMPGDFHHYRSHVYASLPVTLGYTLLAWIMDGMFQWQLLIAAGFHCSLTHIVAINAIVTLMGILSILPIGLGTTDLSALYLYTSLLYLPQSVVVFLLWAARLIGVATLLLLFGFAVLSHRDLWLEWRKQKQ